MPRSKKRKTESQKARQFTRTTNRTGRWRGKVVIQKVFEQLKAQRIARHNLRYGGQIK